MTSPILKLEFMAFTHIPNGELSARGQACPILRGLRPGEIRHMPQASVDQLTGP